MVQVQVPANKKRAQKLLHLNSHVQRDGDYKVVQHQESQEVRNKRQNLQGKKSPAVLTNPTSIGAIKEPPGVTQYDFSM